MNFSEGGKQTFDTDNANISNKRNAVSSVAKLRLQIRIQSGYNVGIISVNNSVVIYAYNLTRFYYLLFSFTVQLCGYSTVLQHANTSVTCINTVP